MKYVLYLVRTVCILTSDEKYVNILTFSKRIKILK